MATDNASAAPFDIVAAARGWIGTPYVHQAALKGVGCDCLGLLRGLYRERFGAEPEALPPYDPGWDSGDESLRDGLLRHLTPLGLDAIAPGDVLLFRMAAGAGARHCAVLAVREGTPTLIHARQNRSVAEERLSAFWRARLAFAFRF